MPAQNPARHKLVPALRDGDPVFRREGVHPLLGEQFVEHRAMHVVDVVIGIDGTEHLLQRPPPVLVGETVPISLEAAPRPALGKHLDETAVPIVSNASALIPCIAAPPAGAAQARPRHDEAAGNDLSRSSSFVRSGARSTRAD